MNFSPRRESGPRNTKWRPAEDEEVVLSPDKTWFPDEKEIRKRKRNEFFFEIALFQNMQLVQGLFRESRRHGGYDVGLEDIALRLLNCSEQTTTIYCNPRGHAWEQLKSCGVLGCHLCGRYQYLRKILGYADSMKEMLAAYQASGEPVYLFSLTRSLPLLTPGERLRALASLARWIRKTGLTGAWRAGGPREPMGVEDSAQWTYEARIVGHAASIELTRAEGLAVAEGWRLRTVPLDLTDPEKAWHGVKNFVWTMPSFREPANYITWYKVMHRKHKMDAFGDWRRMEWALTLTCTVKLPNGEICGAQEWSFAPMEAIYAMPHSHGWGGYG